MGKRTKKAMVKEQEEEIATINFITLCRKPIEAEREDDQQCDRI